MSCRDNFLPLALETFRFQARNCQCYRQFLSHLGIEVNRVRAISEIPFLPIQFFKSHKILSTSRSVERIFYSSGTSGTQRSQHHVADLSTYEESYARGFAQFYGSIQDYTILALLPSYLEREGSSLVYMVNDLIQKSKKPASGFYLNNFEQLKEKLSSLDARGEKVLLIGVSFALLNFVERHPLCLKHTLVMETGGMKGKRKEMVREELHARLKKGFGVQQIHSEYGMTELLSQAYSKGAGLFRTPPWMQVQIRDPQNPFDRLPVGKSGGIDVIDLANRDSCSFIATQDLGKMHTDGSFEILGRFDDSELRGCNLMLG